MIRHLALSSLSLALLTGTAFAQTQQFGTVNVLDAFNLNRSKDGTPNCASTDGQYASDGTKSWEPSCFGTFISNGATKVYPTRGTEKNPDGTPNSNAFASLLVQFQSNGAVASEPNGIFVNADVVGGPVSAGSLNTTNTTGQLISLRQRPGPNGEKPPTTWGHNVDLHIAPGAGNVVSFGVEYDQNNFNKDCSPGSDCLSAAVFLNGTSGWPNTAWLFSGNGNVAERLVGVSISGGVLTRTNGDFFSPATSLVVLDGTEYRVRYVNQNRVDAEVPIPDRATASVSWRNAATHYGVLWVGNDNIQDAGFSDGSSSRVAFQAANRHHIGLDTTGGAMPYAVTAAAEQRVCLNGMDSCFSRTGGVTAFEANGGRPLEIVANTDPRSGLRITGQTADGGPILEPTAAGGPNVPLNIRARGNKEVQFHSPAIAYGGVSIRGGAGADFRDMQGFAETIRMRDGQIVTWDQSRIFQSGGWLYFGSANGAANWMRINTATGQVETKLPVMQNAGM